MPSSARGHGTPRRDPLTIIFILIVYPILLCLFAILHILYDCFLKLIASIQWQRYIYSEARKRPRQVLLHSWRSGLGLSVAGTYTAEKASEERLLLRGNVVRTVGRLLESTDKGSGKGKKQTALVPRHLALVVAEMPVRTRQLVYRAFRAAIVGRATKERQEEEHNRREREQTEYAMDCARTLLHCCALMGVEEVSIYDEAGRIKKAFSGRRDWVLEWPLLGEWKASAQGDDAHSLYLDESSSSSSSSSASTPRSSYSSALNSTPSRQKSSSSLRDMCEHNFTSKLDHLSPRIRLTACLHRPSYDNDAVLEETVSNGHQEQGNIRHTKIRVNLLDSGDAKGAVAKAASWIADSPDILKTVEVKTIDAVLQAHGYPSEPDLLIIHGGSRRKRALHGFPPWLVRLCEIYYDQSASPYRPLSSVSIEGAIASFSRSEQRYGR